MRIIPTNCAGLGTVNFWHLLEISAVNGASIRKGDIIGRSGAYFGAPHIHYQFNETNNRSFRIESPYVPVTVIRTCVADCNTNATAP
jgi:murein DD-endopeptidase MepM/ murein hydrolase activator NlpD